MSGGRPEPLLPVAPCAACGTDVLVAWDLDEAEELVAVCARCNAVLPADADRRPADADGLRELGFTLDEVPGDGGGCGGGGCGRG
ncbi:MAG: hypothetical protein EA398_10280 [Deltaproteobacteria bacterium]|nr:MAG: hypothetical protein EA398_10280 [Deltaproteobacteria bacterium]